jgi:hypothetical protein
LGAEGDEQDRIFLRRVATERRKLSAGDRETARLQTLQIIRGEEVTGTDPYASLKETSNEWVRDIQRRFLNRVIRRGEGSKRWDGRYLNEALPPFELRIASCELSDREHAILDGQLEELRERCVLTDFRGAAIADVMCLASKKNLIDVTAVGILLRRDAMPSYVSPPEFLSPLSDFRRIPVLEQR